jgi:signal transduction histidine kinase
MLDDAPPPTIAAPAVTRFALWRDEFLPHDLRHTADDARACAASRSLRRRTRRFISLLFVTLVVCALTSLAHAAQGLWAASIGAGAVVLGTLATLWLVRRGVAIETVGASFLTAAMLISATLAVGAGAHGTPALFWIALAPTLALATLGARAARALFVLTAAVISASLWVMFHGSAATTWIDVSHHPGAHAASLLGAMSAYFALTCMYERENAAAIAELERYNAALLEAQRAAEAASRAKGEFLAAMSHEIRTPMNGVLGMTAAMLTPSLPPTVREGLLTIKESGDTLMALLNDVLDLSRIESGGLVLERVAVDIAAETRRVVNLLAPFARERGNRLDAELAPDLPRYVLGDPLRLRQVTLNLVSNAIKFTRDGRVRVRVRVEGDRLRLDVEDSGVGIAPDKLPLLFRPFTQADASTTRRFGGTGLGLAIVRQLVDAMGGHVSVTSEPGRGSCFSVFIPARVAEAPAEADDDPSGVSARALKLLLAEDNPINRRVATLLLQRMGHQVEVAEDGRRALDLLAARRFDLVLMDCHMPEMDGFEATRKLRERGDRTPVVALTAASLPEERARCLASGMVDVVLKPVRKPELQRALALYAAPA